MLQVSGLSLSFGKRTLFDEVNLTFTEGNCYGIIGANGAGKSTFLKILSGQIEPNKGSVEVGKNQRVAVLNQDHGAFDEHTVLHTVLMGHKKLWQIFQEREELYSKEDFSEQDGFRVAELENEFGLLDGYSAENNAGALLNDLLVPTEFHEQKMQDLPAAMKVKVLLAQALFGDPEILLLDEPTNDLDLRTISWLENFCADYKHTILVVSHDRHFLDAVCTHVVDIDKQRATIYTGNYSFWYESSQLMAKQIADKNKKIEEKRNELLEFIRRFSANASKSKQATSRKKALEKLVLEDIKPSNRKYPGIFFKPERELGNQILNIKGLGFQLEGKYLFKNLDLALAKGEKVGVISRNSLATKYFFELISGTIEPAEGEISWGSTVIKTYLPSDNRDFFNEAETLLEWLRKYVPPYTKDVDAHFLRGFLGRMLFSGDEVQKNVTVLSGGEKVRCMISRMMLQNPNVILLDQPTHHLDLESITAFNTGIKDFAGVVLLATHDRTFMNSCVNRILELTPNGCIDRLMDYDTYLSDPKVKQLQEQYYQ